MTSREFHGEAFWSFLQREYDTCRQRRKAFPRNPDAFDLAELKLTKLWETYVLALMRDPA